jgi:glycosyltransferase involved in cell wall biosynthesis
VVVHDVVNIEYPETMQWTNVLANKLFYKRSIRKADLIWTNSLYTRQKVEHYFPQRRCKEIFTGCSVNRNLYQPIPIQEDEADTIKKELGIQGHFILFVGSLEPRKNLSFLLSLMPEIYKRTGRQLVVVGAKGWKNSGIREMVEDKAFPRQSTVFCGYVSNEQLAKLYNMADCFVSASLNEGFGMPQLEALLCGCPIVTAHNSAMIEVAQGKKGAVTVEGYDPQVWTEQICEVCKNRPPVDITQLAAYDWDLILGAFLQYLSSK